MANDVSPGTDFDRSARRLKLMAESVTDYALILTDENGRITDWSAGAEAIFGWSAKQMVGRSADVIFTKEDRAAGVPEMEMRTAVEKGRAMDERWHARKDRSRIYMSGVMTPLLDGKELLGFAKIARDLTGQMETQKVLRESEMLRRLVDALEEERTRIARDLHDQLGQQMTAMRLKIQTLRKAPTDDCDRTLDEIQAMAERIDNEVSFIAWELRPRPLDEIGLRNAFSQFIKGWSTNYKIEAEFHTASGKQRRLPSDVEINLYRIMQEALNNISKHARATKATVTLEYNKKEVVLAIEDDGRGFNVEKKRALTDGKCFGLIGMQERAALVGGVLNIESARGKGTIVAARVPLKREGNGRTAGGK